MVHKEKEKQILECFREQGKEGIALKMIIETYQKPLYWQIRRMVIRHEDADDVLQNTFIKIWQGLKNFEGKSALFTWVYRIAMNEALQFLRKLSKEKNIPYEEVSNYLCNTLSVDPNFKGDRVQRKLQEAIQQLPEQQRLVFLYRYYDELPYETIAEIMNTSVGSLKVSYHNAVKKIEEFMLEHAV